MSQTICTKTASCKPPYRVQRLERHQRNLAVICGHTALESLRPSDLADWPQTLDGYPLLMMKDAFHHGQENFAEDRVIDDFPHSSKVVFGSRTKAEQSGGRTAGHEGCLAFEVVGSLPW